MPSHQFGLIVSGGELEFLVFLERGGWVGGVGLLLFCSLRRWGDVQYLDHFVVMSNDLHWLFLVEVYVFISNKLLLIRCSLAVNLSEPRDLEDMLPSEETGFTSLEGGGKGTIGAWQRGQVHDWDVRIGIEGYRFLVFCLPPDQNAIFFIAFHPCASWQRIIVSCLLRPMLGRQEAPPQIR